MQAQTAFPDLAKAAEAVRRTFRILDRQPAIDPAAGATVELEGGVELKRVTFAYPSRPGRLILKDFNLAVPAGTSCALVGESGHGKSTIIGLLERFYEPQEGQVGGASEGVWRWVRSGYRDVCRVAKSRRKVNPAWCMSCPGFNFKYCLLCTPACFRC